MPGKPIKVGPFIGGLNNVSTAGESSDDEVVELVNFDLALDTSLVSRPPFEITMPISTENNWIIHGVYRITADDWYVIASQPSTNANQWFLGAWALGDMTSGRVSIKTLTGTNNVITGYVQYNDWCYFSVGNGSSIAGFRWKKDTAAADITTMPKGSVLVSWRDRLWVTGSQTGATGNYVWFSTVDASGPKPNTWNVSVDFFNVDPGSGGLNTAMLPLTNSLLIFKEDATYRFSFPNAPKQGEISSISRQIGAAGPNSVAAFENYAFIYDQGRVYELMNTKFSQLNINVDFGKTAADSVDSTAPGVDMSIVSRRLIIRYYTNIFAYAIDTKTWSQWHSYTGTPGMFIELPGDSNSAQPSIFLAGLAGVTQLAGSNRIFDPGFQDKDLNAIRSNPTKPGTIVIEEGSATITSEGPDNTFMYLTRTGTAEFDIPVSSQQVLTISIFVSAFTKVVPTDSIIGYIHYNKLDGTNVGDHFNIPGELTIGLNTFNNITVPSGAYLASIQIGVFSTGMSVTFSNPSLKLKTGRSPAGIVKFIDGYQDVTSREFIKAVVKTKAYDYQANSVFKRLFLWGVDVVTPREMVLKAIPLGKIQQVTWKDMQAYTWGKLNAGIWRNPLSWRGTSTTITDITGPFVEVSENGRFFVQSPKSLRFRQIQYSVELSTLGNRETGPAKLFSITTYTDTKAKVVDKAT